MEASNVDTLPMMSDCGGCLHSLLSAAEASLMMVRQGTDRGVQKNITGDYFFDIFEGKAVIFGSTLSF